MRHLFSCLGISWGYFLLDFVFGFALFFMSYVEPGNKNGQVFEGFSNFEKKCKNILGFLGF
jgi:hypothetical protein